MHFFFPLACCKTCFVPFFFKQITSFNFLLFFPPLIHLFRYFSCVFFHLISLNFTFFAIFPFRVPVCFLLFSLFSIFFHPFFHVRYLSFLFFDVRVSISDRTCGVARGNVPHNPAGVLRGYVALRGGSGTQAGRHPGNQGKRLPASSPPVITGLVVLVAHDFLSKAWP